MKGRTMKRFLIAAVIISASLVACEEANVRDVPDPYRDQIVKLRSDSIALTRQCADLQKQMSEMQAKMTWDQAQMNAVSIEALNSLGYSAAEWTVNIDRLKITPKKTR
jgi:peptidoglycan hydrolase CwlO-like protein